MKIGIIGTGNMGSAILKGISPYYKVYAYDVDVSKLKELSKVCSFKETSSEKEITKYASYIILAVKPDKIKKVLEEIKDRLTEEKCIISIAAGISLSSLRNWSGNRCAVVRVMPNTPSLVGKGIFGICFEDKKLKDEQKDFIVTLFKYLGNVYELEEKEFDAFTALVGCGPAYIYYFLESLIEAGVAIGFTKQKSKELAFGLIEGSLELAKALSLPISELKYMVTSPSGATIYALNYLDRKSTKASIIDAVITAYNRCKELAK